LSPGSVTRYANRDANTFWDRTPTPPLAFTYFIHVIVMWCCRKMFEIFWAERVTNEEVLDRVKEKRRLWKCIQSRRDKAIDRTPRVNTWKLAKNNNWNVEGYVEKRKIIKGRTQDPDLCVHCSQYLQTTTHVT